MSLRVSVYIPSYNQKRYLAEAIESVLNQTLRPFEIIIVDDCSTDGSQEVIDGYARKYPELIRPFYHDHNLGIAQNRNFALKQVRGDLVTYLDGDDRFLPRKLELQLETLLQHPRAQIVYTNVYYIDPDGQRTGMWVDDTVLPPSGYVFPETFGRKYPKGNLFREELVPYSCVREVGFYDAGLLAYEDWDLKIRLTKHFEVAYCPELLTEHRDNPEGLSKLPAALHLDSVRRIYKKNRPLLSDLPLADQVFVEKRLSTTFARFAWRSAVEALGRGDAKFALKYFLEYLQNGPEAVSPRPLVQAMLPRPIYLWLRATYQKLVNFVDQ